MTIFVQYQVIWFNIPTQAEYLGLSITTLIYFTGENLFTQHKNRNISPESLSIFIPQDFLNSNDKPTHCTIFLYSSFTIA